MALLFFPVNSRLNFKKFLWGVLSPLSIIFLMGLFSDASSEENFDVHLEKIQKNKLKSEYNGPFRHPFKFTKDEVHSLLQSIYFSRSIIFWRKPRLLFSDIISEKMAHPISRAFEKANPRQVISFKIHHDLLKLEGEAFINKEGLNWKILSVSNLSESFRKTGIWDDNWKLITKKGQQYSRYKDALGLETENFQWITISGKNIKLFVSRDPKKKSATPETNQAFEENIFLENLRQIKSQYKLKTILQKEYYQKLQNIIDQSGWNDLSISRQMKVFKFIDKEHLLPKFN
jgi:hypothetical protein